MKARSLPRCKLLTPKGGGILRTGFSLPCSHLITFLPNVFQLLSSPYPYGLHPPCYSRPSACESAWNPLFPNTVHKQSLLAPYVYLVKLLSVFLLCSPSFILQGPDFALQFPPFL